MLYARTLVWKHYQGKDDACICSMYTHTFDYKNIGNIGNSKIKIKCKRYM